MVDNHPVEPQAMNFTKRKVRLYLCARYVFLLSEFTERSTRYFRIFETANQQIEISLIVNILLVVGCAPICSHFHYSITTYPVFIFVMIWFDSVCFKNADCGSHGSCIKDTHQCECSGGYSGNKCAIKPGNCI